MSPFSGSLSTYMCPKVGWQTTSGCMILHAVQFSNSLRQVAGQAGKRFGTEAALNWMRVRQVVAAAVLVCTPLARAKALTKRRQQAELCRFVLRATVDCFLFCFCFFGQGAGLVEVLPEQEGSTPCLLVMWVMLLLRVALRFASLETIHRPVRTSQ